jgi:membrane-associated protease RseP (regulator of RpoE activity)
MGLTDLLLSTISNPFFIISVVFWIIAFLLVKIFGKNSKNVSIFFPFIAMIRTEKLNKLFRRIARRNKRFWKVFWNIGVIGSFIFMVFALYFFSINLYSLIINPKPENIIVPLIPGVTVDLPIFSYLIIPILITVTVHEFSHAIAAESDDIDIKSSGIFGAGIFFVIGFGAFVEVDEFQLYSKKIKSGPRLRVAAAGVWSNIILAGIILLSLNYFPQMIGLSYKSESFKITSVVSYENGGYNENNIAAGDIILEINGTTIDANKNIDLGTILNNETSIKCSIGDSLELTCYNPDNTETYKRNIHIGAKNFVGFEYEKYNSTAIKIGQIHSSLIGGNNENLIQSGVIIVKMNNTSINYSNGNTFQKYLTQKIPNYKLNLTSENGTIYTINVNLFPKALGAHVFYNVFLGIDIEVISNNSIKITNVFNNQTESGVNEGNIPENIIISSINGVNISLVNPLSFKEYFAQNYDINPGDKIIFQDQIGNNYSLQVAEIPVSPVFIGISHESYWIPKNWVGNLFGPTFPNIFYIELAFTWMVSISVALFNLLPTAIFDGGRLTKEIINAKVGNDKIEKHVKKKNIYEYEPEDSKQHLMTHNINEVLSVREIIPNDDAENEEDKYTYRDLKFKPIDSYNNGFIDSIEIIDEIIPEKKSLIEVEFDYDKDLKEPIKKKINLSLSIFVGLIILANMIISLVKFRSILFLG